VAMGHVPAAVHAAIDAGLGCGLLAIWSKPGSPATQTVCQAWKPPMNHKITEQHRSRPAYIYVRQSTNAQVLHHQESTERQYALPPAQQWLGERRPPAAADGAPAAEETNPLLNVSNRATVRWRASRCYESDTPTCRCGTHASVFNASLSSSGSASRRRAGVSITNSQSRSGITRTLL